MLGMAAANKHINTHKHKYNVYSWNNNIKTTISERLKNLYEWYLVEDSVKLMDNNMAKRS